MLTDQEIYDKVKSHLLAQGEQSMVKNIWAEDICAYRGEGGRKCAIGAPGSISRRSQDEDIRLEDRARAFLAKVEGEKG